MNEYKCEKQKLSHIQNQNSYKLEIVNNISIKLKLILVKMDQKIEKTQHTALSEYFEAFSKADCTLCDCVFFKGIM